MNKEFMDAARRLLAIKAEIKETEAALKGLKHDAEALGAALLEDMEEMGLETFAVDNASFFIRTSIKANVLAENREPFYEALRAHDLGDIIRETVPPQTLTAFVKEQLEEGGGELPEWMQDYVSVYAASEIATRKR